MRWFAMMGIAGMWPVALFGASAPPEIGATSPVVERYGPMLLYGDHFDDDTLAVATVPTNAKTDRKATHEALLASLGRVMAGKPERPAMPKRMRWHKIEHKEKHIAYGWSYNAGVQLVLVRNSKGTGEPFVANRPEIWGLWPRRPEPGALCKVWGLNLMARGGETRYAVVDAPGNVVFTDKTYQPYTTHSGRTERNYVRGLMIPEGLKPGAYRLFLWAGLGDRGWSRAHAFEVVPPKGKPAHIVNVRDVGAKGDSVHDDTEAIRKAIAAVEAKGGGRVFFPPGRYLTSDRIDLPRKVELYGTSAAASVIEADHTRPFPAGYPEKALAGPKDAATARTIEIDGKQYLAGTGTPIDWLPALRGRSAMVWMRGHTAVQNLTLEATGARNLRAIIIIGETGGPCREPVVRHCRLLCSTPHMQQSWNKHNIVMGVSVVGGTEDMRLEHNRVRVTGRGVRHLPGINVGAHVASNVFTPPEPHVAHTLFMNRAYEECLIEGNRFEHGGRAKTEQCAYHVPSPSRHNCWRANIFFNNRKGDGEVLMHEFQRNPQWFGKAGKATAVTIAADDVDRFYQNPSKRGPWPENEWTGGTVFINAGRGVGQLRKIVSHTGDELTVDRPWDLVPDKSTHFCILPDGLIECVFTSNDYLFNHYYSGVFGSALRTVWTHEEIESMGGGIFFWGVGHGALICMNVAHGLRLHQDAGVLIRMGRREALQKRGWKHRLLVKDAHCWEKYPDWFGTITSMPRAFGNEVRNCYIKDRSVVYTSNSPLPWTYRHRQVVRGQETAVSPLPDRVAGIAIADQLADGNAHGFTWDVPDDDDFPVIMRWNVFFSNLLVNCPIGIHVGPGVEKTIVEHNTMLQCHVPVKDDGKNTIENGSVTKHFYQLQAERAADPSPPKPSRRVPTKKKARGKR